VIDRISKAACLIALATSVAYADPCPLTVDGDLSDWNVLVADNNGSNINSFTSAMGSSYGLIDFHAEDQDDNAGHGSFLGPNYGGQDYDGEILLAAICDDTLFLAIATGQRPDNGSRYYAPGDIYIGTSGGTVFGIEVGGGAGGGAGTAIDETAAGTTYALNGSGYTTGATDHASPGAGDLYRGTDANWILDPIAPKGPVQIDPDNPGAYVATGDYLYTRDSETNQHAIIEFAIDLSAFGGHELDMVAWHPSCGNDELLLQVDLQPVPEPGTFALLGAAIAFFAFRRRRRA